MDWKMRTLYGTCWNPRGSVILEQYNVDSRAPVRAQQAWRPVADEVAHVCPGPCPNLGIITTDSDIYTKASVLLEGEQSYALPFEGSEQRSEERRVGKEC